MKPFWREKDVLIIRQDTNHVNISFFAPNLVSPSDPLAAVVAIVEVPPHAVVGAADEVPAALVAAVTVALAGVARELLRAAPVRVALVTAPVLWEHILFFLTVHVTHCK